MSKEYKCNVIINFEGNHIEAENKEDYIEKLKKISEYNLMLI